MAALFAYVQFLYKNYMRRHRYLRELIAVVIFSIFYGGFLSGGTLDDHIWLVFGVFAVLLNLLTAPSVFFLESGNTLTFLLSHPGGRQKLFHAKIILIVLIDLFWVGLFAAMYGLRFLSAGFFLLMPVKLIVIAMVLLLSTLLLSLAYTYRPQITWLIFVLLIFGFIVPKAKLFPLNAAMEFYKLFSLLLPPFTELLDTLVSITAEGWQPGFLQTGLSGQMLFVGWGCLQIAALYFFSRRLFMRKDLI